MLDAEGSVKIGDFGIAQFVDDPSAALTTTGHIVGTSLYLAPERALGRTAGAASDMYSLGCVVYQLLLGQPPFRSDTATATLYQHVDTPPTPLRQRGVEMSAAFDSYLLGLLAKQPEERPSAQQVADWFLSEAWRGQAEPLPQHRPAPPRAASPAYAPTTAPPAVPGRHSGADSGAPTTYRLPQAQGHGRRAAGRSRNSRRRSTREAIRRRPRVASAIAGTIAFLAAVYLGMSLFSPDSSSATTPQDSGTTSGSVSPAP